MPKQKKHSGKRLPKRRTKGKGKGSGRLALYIFIAILVFGAIYWLGQTQSSAPSESDNTEQTESISKKNKKVKKAKKHKKTKKHKDAKAEKPAKTVDKVAVTAPSTNIEESILSALAKLNIAESSIKKKKKDNVVTYQIPIDPALLDLTFSNMIFKGEIEKSKGKFLSGQEKGGRQFLTFYEPATKLKYILELYYKKNEQMQTESRKALAIIVDDFGNNGGNLLNGFLRTDPAVCFAIMPDTPYAQQTMNAAQAMGRECIIHVPMEPLNYPRENPGDKAIFIQQSASEITKRMERFIKDLPYCRGINNHMGSLATSDETTMKTVMQTLRKHKMYFVDSRTNSSSIAYKTAQKNLVTAYKRDIFLDEPDLSEANLNKRISDCLALSATKPYIVAIMHCHTQNHLNYLNRFIAKAKANGFTIVPVSKLGTLNLPEIQ